MITEKAGWFQPSINLRMTKIDVLDWSFEVDLDATHNHTTKNSTDHCTCGYCRNFYEALPLVYPSVISFLSIFGVNYQGPSELMPFTPTLMLACYRIRGKIVNWGREVLSVDGIPIVPEANDGGTIFLWVGEMELPWLQEEDPDQVLSPANQPEFLLRMQEVWLHRHSEDLIYS